MATLFNKDDILAGEEREETIYFSKLYEIPEDMEDPYITIKINDSTRDKQKKAFSKFLKPRVYSQRNDRCQLVSPDKTLEYVMQMLQVAMGETEHLLENFSLSIFRKKLARSQALTKFLANEITEAFYKDAVKLKTEEEDDEKN
jgi:hypothetical protein